MPSEKIRHLGKTRTIGYWAKFYRVSEKTIRKRMDFWGSPDRPPAMGGGEGDGDSDPCWSAVERERRLDKALNDIAAQTRMMNVFNDTSPKSDCPPSSAVAEKWLKKRQEARGIED